MYIYPGPDAHPTLSQELQDALDCPDCMVKCRRHLFSASVSYSFYRNKSRIFRNYLSYVSVLTLSMFFG